MTKLNYEFPVELNPHHEVRDDGTIACDWSTGPAELVVLSEHRFECGACSSRIYGGNRT